MNMQIVQAVINFILKILALFKNSDDTVDTASVGFISAVDEDVTE